jgi:phosphoribosylaminoimidazole carboxylase (NCAIR synthetase)
MSISPFVAVFFDAPDTEPMVRSRLHGATVGLITADERMAQSMRAAAVELGVALHILAVPSPHSAATGRGRDGCRDELGDLIVLAARCHVVTVASATIAPSHLDALSDAGITIRPGCAAVEFADDTVTSLQLLQECGFDVARTTNDATSGAQWVGRSTVVVARRPSGYRSAYPIAHTGPAPRRHSPLADERAIAAAIAIADGIDASGIVVVEFFHAADGRAYVKNVSLGPQMNGRPAVTSQHENHLRAVLDWPLGTI